MRIRVPMSIVAGFLLAACASPSITPETASELAAFPPPPPPPVEPVEPYCAPCSPQAEFIQLPPAPPPPGSLMGEPVVAGPDRYLPSVYLSDDPDSPCHPSRQAPDADAEDGFTCMELLFATNRRHPYHGEPDDEVAYPADPADFFTDKPMYETGVRGGAYTTGRISVTVPHRLPGDPVRPFEREERLLIFFKRQNGLTDEERRDYFTTNSYELLAEDDFWSIAQSRLVRGGALEGLPDSWINDAGTVLVFVHGFRESLESAAFRTAQLTYDLEFAGVPMFFSWPATSERSVFSSLRYFNDVSEGLASTGDLKAFLLDVNERLQPDKFVVIAHSHGNQLLIRALNEMAVEMPGGEEIFDAIVFASADVDAYEFERVMARAGGLAGNKTLYAASIDKAIRLREFIAELGISSGEDFKPRAGALRRDTLSPIIVPGVHSIDVTSARTGHLGLAEELQHIQDRLSHSIYADSCDIVLDIRRLINHPDRDPQERLPGLTPVTTPEGKTLYWRYQGPSISEDRAWCEDVIMSEVE